MTPDVGSPSVVRGETVRRESAGAAVRYGACIGTRSDGASREEDGMSRARTWLVVVAAALGVVGCASEIVSDGSSGGAGVRRQWLCSTDSETVECDAAISAETGREAYACLPGDTHLDCPTAAAVFDVRGQVDERGRWGTFVEEPFACLTTGGYQRTCVKDLRREFRPPRSHEEMETRPEDPPAEEPPAEGEFGDMDVEPPADCSIGAWETFFCDQATVSYRRNGADVSFPCDIFDGTVMFDGDLGGVLSGGGFGPGGAGGDLGSCGPGELDMRSTAWTRAVELGCLELNMPILVMCQQAANYAPASGACTATGTW